MEYTTLADFRDKLRKQLVFQARELRNQDKTAEQSFETAETRSLRPVVAFGDPPKILEDDERVEIDLISCTDSDDIPDFNDTQEWSGDRVTVITTGNRDYYRQLIKYARDARSLVPIRIGGTNLAGVGARDVLMDLGLRGEEAPIGISVCPPERPKRNGIVTTIFSTPKTERAAAALDLGAVVDDYQEVRIEFPVIQAKRTVLSNNAVFIAVPASTTVLIYGTVYTSNSPPFDFEKRLLVRVVARQLTFLEILREMGESLRS